MTSAVSSQARARAARLDTIESALHKTPLTTSAVRSLLFRKSDLSVSYSTIDDYLRSLLDDGRVQRRRIKGPSVPNGVWLYFTTQTPSEAVEAAVLATSGKPPAFAGGRGGKIHGFRKASR